MTLLLRAFETVAAWSPPDGVNRGETAIHPHMGWIWVTLLGASSYLVVGIYYPNQYSDERIREMLEEAATEILMGTGLELGS
jgi:hypothetical protein